jgi:hypothetical protein
MRQQLNSVYRLRTFAHALSLRAGVGTQFCSVTAGDIFSFAYRRVDTFKVTNLK